MRDLKTLLFVGAIAGILSSANAVFSQSLSVDSVSVDSVWNSDSSWYDNIGIAQLRESRDCRISFKLLGKGKAWVYVSNSVDSGITFSTVPSGIDSIIDTTDKLGASFIPANKWNFVDSLLVLQNGLSLPLQTGRKLTITVRVGGGDRQKFAFKITARQYRIDILGDPDRVMYKADSSSVYVPNSAVQVPLKCKIKSRAAQDSIQKVWWNAYGDNSWDDSTPTLNWVWNTLSPDGLPGQLRAVIVKARNTNGIWSFPETLTVQFGNADKPVIIGNPKTLGLVKEAFQPVGTPVNALLQCKRTGGALVEKYLWDVGIDGSWDDSTSVPQWTWSTTIPQGTFAERTKKVAVIARGINSRWSSPETLTVEFGLRRSILMKDIPAGTFAMGSSSVDRSSPVHQVTLSAFKLQETEVTQEQFFAVMGVNPSLLKSGADSILKPVDNITWFDAARFCNALSIITNFELAYDTNSWLVLPNKNGYRLPTEAQWEYACRAGSDSLYWWGNSTIGMDLRAWTSQNSSNTTHPVATKTANSFGLFDMAGNIQEWCYDWNALYINSASVNPDGPSNGQYRIIRGGSYAVESLGAGFYPQSAARYCYIPSYSFANVGFRVVLP